MCMTGNIISTPLYKYCQKPSLGNLNPKCWIYEKANSHCMLYNDLYSFSFQYKKHRLSVGQTNNYAKSVVNMADMVRLASIRLLGKISHKHSALGPTQTYRRLSMWTTHLSWHQPGLIAYCLLSPQIPQQIKTTTNANSDAFLSIRHYL